MKKFFISLGIVVVVGLSVVAAAIIYVDPFFHFHAPLSWFPYVVDNQVDMNPGLARHMDYDSVLLGSSMTVAFDTSWFEQEMGLKTQKLSYNGAYPKDQSNIMDIIFDAKGDSVKRVFLGIDELNYSGDINETKFPITDYLYDDKPLNDIKYVLNKDVLLDYVLRPLADRKDASDWNMIYKPWWEKEHYSKALVLMYYEPDDESIDSTPTEDYIDAIAANLDVNILPYIESHPNTQFTVFYPPYSILYWYDAVRSGRVDSVIAKYDYMTRSLLSYDNVEVYFFQDNVDIITNLNNYADYTHYSPEICHYMTSCMSTGTERVTSADITPRLDVFRDYIYNYDYEAIWDNWYE